MKKGSSRLGKILIVLLLIAVYFWFMLPPINPRSQDFWIFVIYCIVINLVVNFFAQLKDFLTQLNMQFGKGITPGPGAKMNTKNIGKSVKISLIALVAVGLLMVIGMIIGHPIFNASRYQKLITVTEGDFADDIAELSMSQIPVVDKDTASRLGRRKLGEISDLVSQFEIENTYTQINFNGSPVRVTPLTYGDPFKWLNNQSEGIPAYIYIDMVTQEAYLNRLDDGIRYSPHEYFMRNLQRHLRFQYPTKIFDDIAFEIDDDGTPYWVAPTIQFRIGLWSGKDIGGAVLVNAITGESTYYDIGNLPNWVDQIYNSSVIMDQLNYYGAYQSGFFNSIFGQKNVLQTTDGYNYIAKDDDVWVYTGMTSVTSDESNIGFMLVNLRTKDARFYSVPGAEEYSAMDSAQGQVQHLGYQSTFPLLLNVSDRPTYFMSLKDDAGLVKMYAFVDVEQYQVVGTGNTVDEARTNYISKLKNEDVEIPVGEETEKSGTITAISAVVIEGNTCYYFLIDNDTEVYTAYITVSESLPFLEPGDRVTVTFTETDGVRSVTALTAQ